MATTTFSVRRCSLLFSLLALTGCGGMQDDDRNQDDVGVAVLDLMQVPSDVRCLRITVTGSRTVTKLVDVMPGQNAQVSMNKLPLGVVTVAGDAFGGACSSVGNATIADWVSDAVLVIIGKGAEAKVTLTFRRNGRAQVSTDFVDDAPCPAGQECFFALLTPAQENPPQMNSASGMGVFVLDPGSGQLLYHLTHTITDATAQHIHGAPAGRNGPVLFPFPGGSDISGAVMMTPAQVTELQAGRTYANVHSPASPGGAIRGQILHLGESLYLARLSGAEEVPSNTSTGTGSIGFILDAAGASLKYDGVVSGLSSDLVAAHIHGAPVGVNGPVIYPLAFMGMALAGTQAVTPADVTKLDAGLYYANVHTMMFPGGEARGQIAKME
jgi:hypothetical protein